jgi:hypothetical protein
MTRPRSEQVCVTDTPWYHVVSRCVRRAFLCGEDRFTGRNFDHRRGWIEARVRQLSAVFAVDVAAYAVMSNHYHIVLRLDPGRAEAWAEEEVLRRWTALFSGPMLVRRYLDEAQRPTLSAAECGRVREWAETYRARLADLSWYMRVLNETIARQANAREAWAIPFAWADYLDLVETLGRCVHPAKKGFIPEQTPRLLDRLGMDAEAFISQSASFLQAFGQAVGTPERLVQQAAQRQVRFLRGMDTARRVFHGTVMSSQGECSSGSG